MLYIVFFLLRLRRPPRSPRTYTLFPSTTLSDLGGAKGEQVDRDLRPLPQQPDVPVVGPLGYGEGAFFAEGARVRLSLAAGADRSEEHTSELQSLMRISYAVFCLTKKKI